MFIRCYGTWKNGGIDVRHLFDGFAKISPAGRLRSGTGIGPTSVESSQLIEIEIGIEIGKSFTPGCGG
jgi:hypothetical protein